MFGEKLTIDFRMWLVINYWLLCYDSGEYTQSSKLLNFYKQKQTELVLQIMLWAGQWYYFGFFYIYIYCFIHILECGRSPWNWSAIIIYRPYKNTLCRIRWQWRWENEDADEIGRHHLKWMTLLMYDYYICKRTKKYWHVKIIVIFC